MFEWKIPQRRKREKSFGQKFSFEILYVAIYLLADRIGSVVNVACITDLPTINIS